MATYQFVRLQGYPRGSARKKGTLSSVLSEGRREPSHSRHVESPSIEVTPVEAEWDSIREYQAWIEATMAMSSMPQRINGKVVQRKIRSDAPALGTVIASLPSLTEETPRSTIDRFRQDCTDWFKEYLQNVGMRLNYCVLHMDEKYPHLHLWFTPGKEMLSRNEWSMSSVTGAPINIKQNMRRDFFRDVGHKYSDELEKPKNERKDRIPSRAVAAKNRQSPGTPNSGSPLMGMPVSSDEELSPGRIEKTPFYEGTVRRLIDLILQQRDEVGSLTEEQIIRLMAERSGASMEWQQEIVERILADRRQDGSQQSGREYAPAGERLNSFKANSSGEIAPASSSEEGASKPSKEKGQESLLDQIRSGRRYKGNTPPQR